MNARASFVRDPDARRLALIEACAHGLAARGARGVSVRTICADAGVSPGLLRHYFAGIDDLIAATYRHVGGRVSAASAAAVAAAGPSPQARLHAYITASFRPPIASADLLATWLAFWSLVKTDPAIAALHADLYAGYRRELEALLLAAGVAPHDAGLAAVAVTALVDGLWLELSLESGAFSAEEAGSIAARWVATWLPSGLVN